MRVVADASPVCYLVLIEQAHLLEALFGGVLIPDAVASELRDPRVPRALSAWMADPPGWLRIEQLGAESDDPRLLALDRGEREALGLALQVGADLVIIDDREAREAARQLGLVVTGLLGVLDAAAKRGLVDLRQAVARLRKTGFRAAPGLLKRLLEGTGRASGPTGP